MFLCILIYLYPQYNTFINHRLFLFLFARNKNGDLINYILSLLSISSAGVIKILNHKVKDPHTAFGAGAYLFHRERIIQQLVRYNSLPDIKRLITIISQKVFIDQIFINDDSNTNGLESGISIFIALSHFIILS